MQKEWASINRIDAPVYMRNADYKQGACNTPFLFIKKPAFDITDPVIYMSKECIEITIHTNNKKAFLAEFKDITTKIPGEPNVKLVDCYELAKKILNDGRDIFISEPILMHVYENTSKIESKTIHVYYADEFKPIPLTKLQQKKLDDIEDLRAKAKVNSLFAKDILITELNKCGYDIEAYDNRYLIYNKVKGYNKLMKDALEYYLNNTIFKDVGCKVTLPKVKSTHKYGYNDVLCDLGNIEIL